MTLLFLHSLIKQAFTGNLVLQVLQDMCIRNQQCASFISRKYRVLC